MHLSRLSLTDFRSYADARIEPGAGFVILTGENGAGKTNLLEAVSLLAPGRGLRGAGLADMMRRDGPGGFAVAARLGEVEIGTGAATSAPDRRQVRVNGAPASANSLSEWLSVLWLTPAMDRLFAEGASGRRRFLDRLALALHPGHAVHATRYEAAMRARNKLLAEEAPDRDWLTALEARMAEHGAALAEAPRRDRRGPVRSVSPRRPKAPSPAPAWRWRAARRRILPPRFAAGRARDAAAGRTLAGPHRTDLIVTHLGKSAYRRPARRVLLDRRAEGAADRPDPRPRRSRRRAIGPPPDPPARRDRRPSRSRCAAPRCSSGSPAPAARSG